MRRLMLTLDTPAANLAMDEALLEWAEAEGPEWEFLRLWESPQPMVVLGRSSRVDQEVNTAACAELEIPVLRRASGGAAIVAGPGCLMYAVVLSHERRPELRGIPRAHHYVLNRLVETIRCHVPSVHRAGTSDLALDQEKDQEKVSGTISARKFSGNSLRAKRTHLLYHGTLLYDFDLSLIPTCLELPPRQPDYRQARGHVDFVTNLPLARRAVEDCVSTAWPTKTVLPDWPRHRVNELVRQRYGQDEWNLSYGRPASC